MAEIKLSPEAFADLQKTKTYIEEELCDEISAVNVIAKITNKIKQLSDFPESGAQLSSIIDLDTDYRFLVCGNYTAFYRYKQNVVYIDRVLNSRRDFMRILFDPPPENDD